MKKEKRHNTLFALLVIAAGALAVALSLVSIEDAQYTGPRPTLVPARSIHPDGEWMPSPASVSEESPLPAENIGIAAEPAVPTPPPMDRSAYADGDLWIRIPVIGVDAAVINGTELSELKKGPGLYSDSVMPDQEDGNVCIAGHRTTYGAWFREVDTLAEGDEIILYNNDRQFYYAVEEIFVVDQYDWSVTEPVGYTALTLTACHPPGSARQRIVVRAKRVRR